jgi:hypothetical protein
MIRKLTIAGLTLSAVLALVPSLGAYPRVFLRPSFGYYGYPATSGRATPGPEP